MNFAAISAINCDGCGSCGGTVGRTKRRVHDIPVPHSWTAVVMDTEDGYPLVWRLCPACGAETFRSLPRGPMAAITDDTPDRDEGDWEDDDAA